MSSKKNNRNFGDFLLFVLGSLAIYNLISFFDDDNSRIISKEAERLLGDKEEMAKINEQIEKAKANNQNYVVIHK